MTRRVAANRMRALALLVAFAGGCRCGGEKREIGLARSPGREAVVVVDRPVEPGGASGGYSGPMAPEAEPNDQRDKAGALAVPGGINGALSTPADIDFYKLAPGGPRMLDLRLVGPAAEAGG